MRKITLVLISILCFHCENLKAQVQDEIEIKQNFGIVFLQNGQKLTPRQILQLTKNNPAAYQEMKIAKSNYTAANITSFAGGFMVGWQLANIMIGKDLDYAYLAVGGTLIGISFIASGNYSKHAKKAIEIYNSGLTGLNMNKIKFNLGVTNSGVGLCMNF